MEIVKMVRRILAEMDTSSETCTGRYNPELDKYVDKEMFPEKMAKAREILAKAGLPPELQNRQVKK
jgi:hypothetical protein